MATFTRHGDILAVLSDDRFEVPEASPPGSTIDIDWLRASVPRFSNGAVHDRRRAVVVTELAAIEPADLNRRAEALAGHVPAEQIAVRVLADAMGVPDADYADVAAVAAGYLGGGPGVCPAAPSAVARLVNVFGGVADEVTAARISILAQACTATAKLIEIRLAGRADPPVPVMRRVCARAASIGGVEVAAGEPVVLDLEPESGSLTFGAGLRPCPGREHALAIADGVIAAMERTSAAVIAHPRR